MSSLKVPRTVAGDLAEMRAIATTPFYSEPDVRAALGTIYRMLFDADLDAYDVLAQRASAVENIQGLFELRLALRGRIADWDKRGFMTHDVQRLLRDVFRITRYGADILGEINIGHDKLALGKPTMRGFTGTDANVLVNPAYYTGGDLPFQPGDVMLVRGRAHNSAAIARIGDVDSQFSHVGIIDRTDDGRLVLVEATIESGAIISPLEHALDHGLGRAILLRHRDGALAARSARAIRELVARRQWRRIWYDFTMAVEGYRRLYCSKLVRYAFLLGSGNEVSLPAFRTRLDMKNRDFLRRIGVKATETFAPGDLEIDPRFDIVAEWQDYRVTSSLRNQDMIASKLFEYMDTYGYVFREDLTVWLISLLGRLSGLLSEDAKELIASVVPKVPPNMRMKTIAAIAMLHKTAEPLLEKLTELERAEIMRSGRAPHSREVMAFLDLERAAHGKVLGYLVAPGMA